MNELQKAVADLIIKATQAAEYAGKFAVEQLPDVAQQYVLFTGVYALVWAVVSFFILLLCLFGWYRVYLIEKKWKETREWNKGGAGWALSAVTIFPVFVCFGIVFVKNTETALMAFLAPKVLLIQWAASLVK